MRVEEHHQALVDLCDRHTSVRSAPGRWSIELSRIEATSSTRSTRSRWSGAGVDSPNLRRRSADDRLRWIVVGGAGPLDDRFELASWFDGAIELATTQAPAPARARAPGSRPGRRFAGRRRLRGRLWLGELGLDLCQLRVDPAVVAELRELAIDVILAAAELREVGERARLLDRALRRLTDVGHLVADARGRLRHLHLGLRR